MRVGAIGTYDYSNYNNFRIGNLDNDSMSGEKVNGKSSPERVFDTFITTYFPSTIVFKPFMAYFFVKFFKFIRACLCLLWYNKNKKVFLCM